MNTRSCCYISWLSSGIQIVSGTTVIQYTFPVFFTFFSAPPAVPLYWWVHIGFAQQDKDQACRFPRNVSVSFPFVCFIKGDSSDVSATSCPQLRSTPASQSETHFLFCFHLQIAPTRIWIVSRWKTVRLAPVNVTCVWSRQALKRNLDTNNPFSSFC